MDRSAAVTVLAVVQITPLLCWRLPDVSRDLTAPATTLGAERHEIPSGDEPAGLEQVERFGLLPTPNVATPILSTLILPETVQHQVFNKPDAKFVHIVEPSSSISVVSSDHPDYEWPRYKQRRKIKINNDGSLWSNFPKTKQLVEIVPIRHKTKKGKALAYIVPKSHSVKKQLVKRKIPNKVVDISMKNFSQGLKNNEENVLIDSSESKSSDFDSDSIQSISFEDLEHQTLSRPTLDEPFSNSLEIMHKDIHDKNDGRSIEIDSSFDYDSEEQINYKLNDIVSYFNDHSGDNLDKLIHNILPDDVEDPEYHLHYILHKKRRPNHHSFQEDKSNMTHHNNLIKIKPKTDNNNQKIEQIHVYTRPHNHEYIKDLYHPDKMIESSESSYDPSNIINEYDVSPVHNNEHHYHQSNNDDAIHYIYDHKSLQHTNDSENDRNSTLKNNDKSDLDENVQDLNNGDHPDFSQVLDEIKIDPRYLILNQYGEPMIHHIHIYGDHKEDVSNQSDDQDTNTSESESYEKISDEDLFEDANELPQAIESFDLTATVSSTDSEHDSDADISLDSGTYDTDEIEYQKHIESTEDSSTEENTNEHNILEMLENSTSSVSVENINNGNGVYDISDLTEHSSIFPNCFHSKKKHSKKCDLCERHKSYTLTFLFNR